MVGTTLVEIRDHIETLSATDGEFLIRCGRTGDQPVPVHGLRFEKRSTARSAAHAASQYRIALRQYDPQLAYYELIVCQETARVTEPRLERCSLVGSQQVKTQTRSDSALNHKRDKQHCSRLVEFCHTAAATVFETLSKCGYDTVENAVMDTYFEFGETVGNPNELCLCILESMSSELDQHLSHADHNKVIKAAAQPESPPNNQSPLDTALTSLRRQEVITRCTHSPKSTIIDADDGVGIAIVQVSGYVLSAQDDHLPVLPLTHELCRHCTEELPQSVQVTAVDDGWQLMFTLTNKRNQDGLIRSPIDGVI